MDTRVGKREGVGAAGQGEGVEVEELSQASAYQTCIAGPETMDCGLKTEDKKQKEDKTPSICCQTDDTERNFACELE